MKMATKRKLVFTGKRITKTKYNSDIAHGKARRYLMNTGGPYVHPKNASRQLNAEPKPGHINEEQEEALIKEKSLNSTHSIMASIIAMYERTCKDLTEFDKIVMTVNNDRPQILLFTIQLLVHKPLWWWLSPTNKHRALELFRKQTKIVNNELKPGKCLNKVNLQKQIRASCCSLNLSHLRAGLFSQPPQLPLFWQLHECALYETTCICPRFEKGDLRCSLP